jgi:TolB-like protein/Tfp pilus assembly protein PilF
VAWKWLPFANRGSDRLCERTYLLAMGRFHSTRGIVRFGTFEADFRAGELKKRGVKIKLQEQPLQVLESLLQHPGEVVTREELKQRIWPADTFVDFEQGLYNSVRRLRDALNDSVEKPRYIETLSKRGYRFVGTLEARIRKIESLAVLPLENMSRDPEQEYFAEGMTEALLTTLAKIGGLRVASRTSAMQYKGVSKPLREIAEELGVDAIVEGSVLRDGNRVRITAQLIDPGKESHLWAESYERDLRDVLTLQAEIAQAIANQIRVKLTPQDQVHLTNLRTVSPEAYEAYLRGRYYWNRRSREGFREAVPYFQQAIAKDPSYAAAQAGLADCFALLGMWGLVPPEEGCGRAKRLALRALELNSSLPEAHASLAWATMWYDHDLTAAEREFERSIELNPRYATAHHWFGWCLAMMGRYEESYTEVTRAIRLDPRSGTIYFGSGCIHLYARRYDQAIQQFERAIDLDSESAQFHAWLGATYLCNSMPGKAIAALQKGVQLSHGATPFLSSLGEAYAADGQMGEALKIFEQLQAASSQRYLARYFCGRLCAALDKKDDAFRLLQAGQSEHDPFIVTLKVDPLLDNLRSDPRFDELLRRMSFA